MEHLLEYAGSVHIYLGPYRGNPIALYLKRTETGCQIGPKAYPWNDVVGSGETPNKAAADFEEKWKTKGLRRRCDPFPLWRRYQAENLIIQAALLQPTYQMLHRPQASRWARATVATLLRNNRPTPACR